MKENQPMGEPMPTTSDEWNETKSYVGTKITQARPMDHETFLRWQGKWQEGQETMGAGYKVTYDDGYVSWSPADVFERCYREITPKERKMIS